jgi:hypothetical protein
VTLGAPAFATLLRSACCLPMLRRSTPRRALEAFTCVVLVAFGLRRATSP